LISIYGKKLKNTVFNNHKAKLAFNVKFLNLLSKLELRLNILLVRIRFARTVLQANNLINKNILINGLLKDKKYIVCVGDLICPIRSVSNNKFNFKFSKTQILNK